jgi:hypothetical protein
VDGGVRNNTPLATAFSAEPPPDEIYVVYASPRDLEPMALPDSGTGFGVGAQPILMRTIEILLNEIDRTDVDGAIKMNTLKELWEALRPELPAGSAGVAAMDAFLAPYRYATIVELRPTRLIIKDGLSFSPPEIRANYEHGREIALALPAAEMEVEPQPA